MSSSPKVSAGGTPVSRSSPKPSNRCSSPCCETGRPILIDPTTGQTVCSCQYNPATAAGISLYPGFPRLPHIPDALYSQALVQAMLPMESAGGLYGGVGSPYDFNKGLPPGLPMYNPFDPAFPAYPFANGFLDPNSRRKNATRESTQTLKAWLNEHKKNPYPTKGEKIMLAIITKMTLTQVSTWFANARRRLKKENKMTWEPRNRMDDDDEDAGSDVDCNSVKDGDQDGDDENISVDSDFDDSGHLSKFMPHLTDSRDVPCTATALRSQDDTCSSISGSSSNLDDHKGLDNEKTRTKTVDSYGQSCRKELNDSLLTVAGGKTQATTVKPKSKIWSMVEIATSQAESVNSSSPSPKISTSSPSPNSPRSRTDVEHPFFPSAHFNAKLPSLGFPFPHALHPAWRSAAHPYFHPHLLAHHRSLAHLASSGRPVLPPGFNPGLSLRLDALARDSVLSRHSGLSTNSITSSLGLN